MMFEVLESAWRDWYTTHAHLSSDIPLVSYPLHSPLTPFSDAHQNQANISYILIYIYANVLGKKK